MKLFNYTGTKIKLTSKVNDLVNKKYTVYYELFLGSGAIWLNIKDNFDIYHINDISKEIISIYKFINNFSYDDFIGIYQEILHNFGDIKINKEAFYEYRQYYNTTYFNTSKIEQGGYLYFLVNSCINSFARFSKNGFNSGYGNRIYILSKETYNFAKNRLKKTILTSECYSRIPIQDNSFSFIDPPYFARPSSYIENFTEQTHSNLKDYILNLKGDFIYTDIKFEDDRFSMYSNMTIRNIKNSSPYIRKNMFSNEEILYTNINNI